MEEPTSENKEKQEIEFQEKVDFLIKCYGLPKDISMTGLSSFIGKINKVERYNEVVKQKYSAICKIFKVGNELYDTNDLNKLDIFVDGITSEQLDSLMEIKPYLNLNFRLTAFFKKIQISFWVDEEKKQKILNLLE